MTKAERETKRKARDDAAAAKKKAAEDKRETRKEKRAETATARKSRILGFIQVAWVVEIMLLIPVVCVYVPTLPVAKLELFGSLLGKLLTAILAEGLAAFAGPNVKRWLAGKYGKPQ